MAEKREDEARRVAGAVASLLFLIVSVAGAGRRAGGAAAGRSCSPPGTRGVKREACIHLVRIVFPGTGLLVL